MRTHVSLRSTQSFARRLKSSFCCKLCLQQNRKTSAVSALHFTFSIRHGSPKRKNHADWRGGGKKRAGEFRLWRIFARSTPDKRACRSPSGECELPQSALHFAFSIKHGSPKRKNHADWRGSRMKKEWKNFACGEYFCSRLT